MSESHLTRLLAELETLITQMQYLVEHPRMQQRNWVANGKVWIPILDHIKSYLASEKDDYAVLSEAHQALLESLKRGGLDVQKRDKSTWGYSWHGTALVGAYASQAQAIEAALREKFPQTG